MILNSPYISGSLTVTNLSGSGVRYLMTSASGLLISQTADAAIKVTYTASSTAGQTVFPVTNGYSTGLIDVFLNGTKLSTSDYSDADGLNITLITGSDAGDLLEFVKYSPALGVTNNALRQLTTFTSSEGQTVYSASYTPGLLDVYYNGSRLTSTEYTANNGTFITLATGSIAGDVIDILTYSYQVGAFSGVGGGGVANQIAFYNTTSSISGSSNFTVSGNTLAITGSFSVFTGSAAEFQVNQTSVNIGNALTDSHVISGSLRVNPNGLFVSGSGIVGIGTTTPSTLLDLRLAATDNVTGSVSSSYAVASFIVSGSGGGQRGLQVGGPTGGINSPIFLKVFGTSQRFAVLNESNIENFTITSAGRVGIGTTNPGYLMELAASSAVVGVGLIINDTNGRSYSLRSDANNLIIRDNTASTDRMTITSAGVVNIPNRNLSRGSMPAGSVIQVVSYNLASGFSTTSASDQDTGLKVSITPTSSTSKILVLVSANARATSGGGNCYVNLKLVRGAFDTGVALHNGFAVMGNFNSTDIRGSVSYSYLDSPATTSSTQYVVSMNSQYASTVYMDSTTSPSTITLLEIAQ